MTSVVRIAENMGHRGDESLSLPGWEAAVKELAHGRESIAKLALLLQIGSLENRHLPESAKAGLLVEEIAGSISRAMKALVSGKTTEAEANQVDSPPSCVTTSSKQICGGKRKLLGTKRIGYRRRGNPYSWTRVTSTTINDKHAWRKYGQKDIFGAKYPRSYFRCTHKFDQGCKASRQVQKSEEDPSLFVITYFGEHTCCPESKALSPCGDPCIINFERDPKGADVKQETLSSLPSLKQDSEEEVLSNLTTVDSPADYFASPGAGIKEFEAGLGQDHNDSSSVLHTFDIRYGMEFMDLEDLFTFDNPGFFQE